MSNDHQLVIAEALEWPDRDHKRIRFACVEIGCLVGTVEGSPAKAMDAIVELLTIGHVRDPKGVHGL